MVRIIVRIGYARSRPERHAGESLNLPISKDSQKMSGPQIHRARTKILSLQYSGSWGSKEDFVDFGRHGLRIPSLDAQKHHQ